MGQCFKKIERPSLCLVGSCHVLLSDTVGKTGESEKACWRYLLTLCCEEVSGGRNILSFVI